MFMLGLGDSAEKKAGNEPQEEASRAELALLDDHFVPYKYRLAEYWAHLMEKAKLLLCVTRGAIVCVPALPLL